MIQGASGEFDLLLRDISGACESNIRRRSTYVYASMSFYEGHPGLRNLILGRFRKNRAINRSGVDFEKARILVGSKSPDRTDGAS